MHLTEAGPRDSVRSWHLQNYALSLVEAEDSLAAIFPDELLSHMQLKLGDELYVTEGKDGSLFISAKKPDPATHNVLQDLAG